MASKTNLPACPRCCSQTYSLVVVVEEEMTSDVVDGVIVFCGQSAIPQPVRAEAKCGNCGHEWRIRNAATRPLCNYSDAHA